MEATKHVALSIRSRRRILADQLHDCSSLFRGARLDWLSGVPRQHVCGDALLRKDVSRLANRDAFL